MDKEFIIKQEKDGKVVVHNKASKQEVGEYCVNQIGQLRANTKKEITELQNQCSKNINTLIAENQKLFYDGFMKGAYVTSASIIALTVVFVAALLVTRKK